MGVRVKIYVAISSSSGAGGYGNVVRKSAYPHLLNAFPYDPKIESVDKLGFRPLTYLTDSGAFSAWTKGDVIDIGAYIRWCHEHRRRFPWLPTVHINLDVIPGQKGRMATAEQRGQGMELSKVNGDRMREAGLATMEVFHQFEPWEFLDELLERRQPGDLIGLSPRKDVAPSRREKWLDSVFHRLMQSYSHDQIPPCHGLGVSGRKMIWRYPWWSVDSTSWVSPSKFGSVLGRDGRQTDEPRTRNKAMREFRIWDWLETWKAWNDQLTNLWATRGIAFQP